MKIQLGIGCSASSALLLGLLCLPLGASAASTFYDQDFETFATGTPGPDGWWNFEGPGTFVNSVWEIRPHLGTQALVYQGDGAGTFGTDWYWYAGIGRSDIATSLGVPAADVTLALDLAVIGSTSATPLTVRVSQWDGVAESWSAEWTPTLTIDGSFSTFSATLDTGSQSGVYDPSRNLSINSLSFNNGPFGLDDGNQVIIDNVRLTAVPEPASIVLLVVAALGIVATRRSPK
jgi:hypothetical protein